MKLIRLLVDIKFARRSWSYYSLFGLACWYWISSAWENIYIFVVLVYLYIFSLSTSDYNQPEMFLAQSFHYFLKNTCQYVTEIQQKRVDHNLGVEIFPLTWCVWLVLRCSGRTASSLGTVIRGAQRWTASWAASRWTTRRSTSGLTSCQHGMCNNTDMFSFYVFLIFLMHVLQCFTNTLLHQIVSH